jgi:hypothetical protein
MPISVLISMIPDIGVPRYRCLPDVRYTLYRVYRDYTRHRVYTDIGITSQYTGPDINTDIGNAVYDIGDKMTRYRGVPDIGVNIGVNVTR